MERQGKKDAGVRHYILMAVAVFAALASAYVGAPACRSRTAVRAPQQGEASHTDKSPLHREPSGANDASVMALAAAVDTTSPHAPLETSPCGFPIIVVGEHDARVGEQGFERAIPLLRDPENSWAVPGPGPMRALIKHDQNRKPALYLEDTLSQSVKRVDSVFASGPVRWSSDGKLLGVVSWQSRERAWVPCVIQMATGKVIKPTLDFMGTGFKWSPDGRWIAVDGRAPGGPMSYLWLMSSSTGACLVLDTLGVYSNYEFGWSPDSRLLVVSRPLSLSEEEDKTRSDLWLFDTSGRRSRLLGANGLAARNPRWVDARHIIYRREVPDMSGAPRERILTVA